MSAVPLQRLTLTDALPVVAALVVVAALFTFLYRAIVAATRPAPCTRCACANYNDEPFWEALSARSATASYGAYVVDAGILGTSLVCSACGHGRGTHGGLAPRRLVADALPNGGAVMIELASRRRAGVDGGARLADVPLEVGVELRRPSAGGKAAGLLLPGMRCQVHYDGYVKEARGAKGPGGAGGRHSGAGSEDDGDAGDEGSDCRAGGGGGSGGSSLRLFESSRDSQSGPLSMVLGAGDVIPGWDMGMRGMRVGEVRRITVPPHLAYGSSQVGGVRDATLVFDIEVLALM
ncbi:hypothetical protein MMPV_009067 [Pyropia vietnamensis]